MGGNKNDVLGMTHVRALILLLAAGAIPQLVADSRATSLDVPAPRATITGSVTFSGAAPAPQTIDMSGHRYCLESRAGEPAVSRAVVNSPSAGLRDVVVFVREAPDGAALSAPAEPVVLDQERCEYVPHVIAMRTGQPLVVRNSDATLHNVHAFPTENRGFNVGQPLRGVEARRAFGLAEVGIPVRCDVHGWMNAVIHVFDHPYFAVTGDDGHFVLDGMPPGEYIIDAWHQTLGVRSQTVVLDAGTATVAFEFQN